MTRHAIIHETLVNIADPPAEKLKRLMMMHGGRYIYYPTKVNTTHIIATNLAYTKIKDLKTEKVVTPNWITDR